MIRMRMASDWVPRMVHEPVKVSGRLLISPSQREVVVVDAGKRPEGLPSGDAAEAPRDAPRP